MDPPNIIGYLERKIFEGWIIVIGDSGHYSRISREMEGKDTIMMTIPIGRKLFPLMLIRKTPGVYTAFGRDENFKYLILVEFVDPYTDTIAGQRSITWQYHGNKKGFPDFVRESLHDFLTHIEKMGNGEKFKQEMSKEELYKKIGEDKKKKSKPRKRRKHISKSIRHEVFVRDKYKCCECGATKENTTLHIDHIIPVAQGGTDEMSNLQTLCEACNLAKSSRAWKSE